MKSILYLVLLILAVSACTPPKDPPPAVVNQQATYKLSPRTQSTQVGGEVQYQAVYTGADGSVLNVTPALVSLNPSLAEITADGKVKALAAGSVGIISAYRGLSDTVNLNIVQDSTQLASIYLTPDTSEVIQGQSMTLQAEGRDLAGRIIPITGLTLVPSVNGIGLISGLQFTGQQWGTTNVTAVANGIRSNPVELAVVRKGSFRGIEGHSGRGAVTVKLKNGQVIIRMEQDFVCQQVPDPRVMLSNTGEGGAAISRGGIELAILRMWNGRQSYLAPTNVGLGDYRHCVVYCRQFSQGVITAELR